MSTPIQRSEAFRLSALLAFSGGFQDAYTYIQREHVFANAQTGNVVLMATNLISGQFRDAMHYLFPLLAFTGGVFAAEQIENFFKASRRIHWRQGILLIEIAILLLVGFIPGTLNTAANMLVSFSCALQVQTFRKVHGNAYASTMCIGNLRSGTAALSSYIRTKQREEIHRALCYFGIIGIFAVGAGVSGNLTPLVGVRAIWICPVILLAGFLFMHREKL